MRPCFGPLHGFPMEIFPRDAKITGIASHFVERNQSVITVKASVLQAFCHHGTGELLKFHGEARDRFLVNASLCLGAADEQYISYEIENTLICAGTLSFRSVDGFFDVCTIRFRDTALRDIGSINWKGSHNFAESIPQAVHRKIASVAICKSDSRQQICQHG